MYVDVYRVLITTSNTYERGKSRRYTFVPGARQKIYIVGKTAICFALNLDGEQKRKKKVIRIKNVRFHYIFSLLLLSRVGSNIGFHCGCVKKNQRAPISTKIVKRVTPSTTLSFFKQISRITTFL